MIGNSAILMRGTNHVKSHAISNLNYIPEQKPNVLSLGIFCRYDQQATKKARDRGLWLFA